MTISKEVKHIILYGVVLTILVLILKWLQWRYLIADNSIEIYIGLMALFFTALGIWVAMQMTKPKIEKVIVEREVIVPLPENFSINEIELKKLNLTNREYQILQLITKGHSNSDIASKLFVSLSTIKTHTYHLYAKMGVKRRAQAIEKAKRLKITK